MQRDKESLEREKEREREKMTNEGQTQSKHFERVLL